MQYSNFYEHALDRKQQRSIPMDVIDYIYDFGRWDYTSHGAEIAYLDKQGRKQAVKKLGEMYPSRIDKYVHVYLIITRSGMIKTVGYRYKRIWRKS